MNLKKTLQNRTMDNALMHKIIEQYESFPFPPVYSIEQEDESRDLTTSFNIDFNLKKSSHLKAGSKIWVPGCGTRWAVLTALQFCECEIVASDLSNSSLDLQKKLAKKLGINNIIFKQENILKTNYLDEFDFISCVGVLHHLPNPKEGFLIINKALKKTGLAEIMVYDYKNRHYSIKMREILSILNADNSISSSCRFELAVKFLRSLNEHAKAPKELKRILKYLDVRPGFSHELADFICNPLEHYYDVESLLELLDNCNLQLYRWKQPHLFSPQKMLNDLHLCHHINKLTAADQAKLGSLMSEPLLEFYVCKKGIKLDADENWFEENFFSYYVKKAPTILKYNINPDGSISNQEKTNKYKLHNDDLWFDAGERRPAVLHYGQAVDCVTEGPRKWWKLSHFQVGQTLSSKQILRMLDLANHKIKISDLLTSMVNEFSSDEIDIDCVKHTLYILCKTPFRIFTLHRY